MVFYVSFRREGVESFDVSFLLIHLTHNLYSKVKGNPTPSPWVLLIITGDKTHNNNANNIMRFNDRRLSVSEGHATTKAFRSNADFEGWNLIVELKSQSR